MEIRINETRELKRLAIADKNGIDWTSDLLGNHDATHYNMETEEHEMSQEDYEWWKEYINNHEADAEEIVELAEELEIEESEIWERINENMNCDMEDEHQVKQNIMDEIRKEYGIA